MIDNKKIAGDIAAKLTFVPADDRILIKPLKPITVVKELPVAPQSMPKSLDDAEAPENEVKKYEKRKTEANVQKGIVIKLGPDYSNPEVPERLKGIEIGDVVYYSRNGGQPFEAFKDSRMLRRYEVLAIEKV